MTVLASGKMPEAQSSDDDLVRRACAGEVSAFEQLVRCHAAMAIGVAFRITRDQGLAEDAAQEAFLKAFRALPAYREQQSFAGWLRTITIRCALDTVRRRRPEVTIGRKEEQKVLVDNRFEKRQEDYSRLQHALSQLPALDREIVLALKADGQSVAEVAQELAMTKTGIRVRAHRALKKLRRILMEDYEKLP
jgi:RNA polymerase sigma-70 factor (ECF subfamily)